MRLRGMTQELVILLIGLVSMLTLLHGDAAVTTRGAAHTCEPALSNCSATFLPFPPHFPRTTTRCNRVMSRYIDLSPSLDAIPPIFDMNGRTPHASPARRRLLVSKSRSFTSSRSSSTSLSSSTSGTPAPSPLATPSVTATATGSSGASPSVSPTRSTIIVASSSLSAGASVGIAFGVIIGVAAIGAGAVYWFRYHKRRSDDKPVTSKYAGAPLYGQATAQKIAWNGVDKHQPPRSRTPPTTRRPSSPRGSPAAVYRVPSPARASPQAQQHDVNPHQVDQPEGADGDWNGLSQLSDFSSAVDDALYANDKQQLEPSAQLLMLRQQKLEKELDEERRLAREREGRWAEEKQRLLGLMHSLVSGSKGEPVSDADVTHTSERRRRKRAHRGRRHTASAAKLTPSVLKSALDDAGASTVVELADVMKDTIDNRKRELAEDHHTLSGGVKVLLDRSDSTGGSITRDSHGQSYATPSAMTISFDRASPLAMPTQQRRLSLPDRPNPMEMQNNPIVRAFLEAEDALPRTTVRMPSSTVRRPKAKKKRILYKAASTKAGTPSRASQPIAGDSGDEGTWIFVHDPPMPVPAIGRPAVVPMGAFVQPVQSSGQQFIAAPSQFVPTQTAQLPQYVSVGLQAPNRITYC